MRKVGEHAWQSAEVGKERVASAYRAPGQRRKKTRNQLAGGKGHSSSIIRYIYKTPPGRKVNRTRTRRSSIHRASRTFILAQPSVRARTAPSAVSRHSRRERACRAAREPSL